VGMLFDPSILVREPLLVLATVLIIVVGKSLAAWLIVRAFGHPNSTALTISASLAQIGEFSFILATLGLSLDLLSPMARDLILGGAILSILINPLLFSLLDRYEARHVKPADVQDVPPTVDLQDHVVLVGYGRVGRGIGEQLRAQGKPFVVIEAQREHLEALRQDGVPALYGNAAQSELLKAAAVERARWLLVAIPEVFEAGQVIENALELNAGLKVVARAHSDAEIEHLEKHGAQRVIMGEREIARGMLESVGQGA